MRERDRQETATDEALDRGLGACWLKGPEIARLVEDGLLMCAGERYRLIAWTLMPNHVHVLLSTMPANPIGQVVDSWKRFTGREANKLLHRSGQFWHVDYWDRFIRTE